MVSDDNYYCSQCGAGYLWEQMTATSTGNLFCPPCWKLRDVSGEAKRKCPVDQTEMEKEFVTI